MAALASRQHGVVARWQLLEMGLGSDAIGRRLRAGRLHRMHPGVYALGHRAIPRHGRWMAAVLSGGRKAVLSHRSAAALWGLQPPGSQAIEIAVPHGSHSRGPVRRHRAALLPDETTVLDGIPVTTVPRTIFDLAADHSPDRVERLLREAEYRELRDALSLPDLLARHPGHRGNATIRECLRRLGVVGGITREELEALFLAFLRRRGLPEPELNVWLPLGADGVRPDCLWRGRGLVAELDGYGSHGTRPAFESDRRRDRQLQAEGWTVVRVTWRQLRDEPDALAVDLERLLDARGRQA